jgi:hypothetical protein
MEVVRRGIAARGVGAQLRVDGAAPRQRVCDVGKSALKRLAVGRERRVALRLAQIDVGGGRPRR